MPLFQPVLSHKVACLGRSQARLLESWGSGCVRLTGGGAEIAHASRPPREELNDRVPEKEHDRSDQDREQASRSTHLILPA